MRTDTTEIERQFDADYTRWEIALPPESIANREGGHIFKAGWHIGYQWGEENREEFLDVFSQHRMAGDCLARYWTSGRIEPLDSPSSMHPVVEDPAQQAEIERRFVERNRRIYADLERRALLAPADSGDPIIEVNECLVSGERTGRRHPTD